MKKLMMIAAVLSLTACSSPAQRMADCQSKGVSKDACYIAEQNRTSAINAAAEKQALENAAQLAQSAHKHFPEGCTQVMDAAGRCDSKPAKASGDVKQFSGEADRVMNKPISDAAEYLLSKGWKPNKGLWHKDSYIMQLVVEKERVVNAQLSKM
ncbi:hypothetical protein [Enterobacter vonholyi]|uniref:hypothetical protein n=1 Tax=Enterobacter vonholyi TaxID=2797505 RepID=UPI00349ED4AB